MIGGSEGRLSLVRQMLLCLNFSGYSDLRYISRSWIDGMGFFWQRLFTHSHNLALEHLTLDLTKTKVLGCGLLW